MDLLSSIQLRHATDQLLSHFHLKGVACTFIEHRCVYLLTRYSETKKIATTINISPNDVLSISSLTSDSSSTPLRAILDNMFTDTRISLFDVYRTDDPLLYQYTFIYELHPSTSEDSSNSEDSSSTSSSASGVI